MLGLYYLATYKVIGFSNDIFQLAIMSKFEAKEFILVG